MLLNFVISKFVILQAFIGGVLPQSDVGPSEQPQWWAALETPLIFIDVTRRWFHGPNAGPQVACNTEPQSNLVNDNKF